LSCALKGCRPCSYKLIIYGNGLLPNQRPEQCPRFQGDTTDGLYDKEMRLLTVGDGDFSFSLGLAKLVGPKVNLVATSHESLGVVRVTYGPAYMEKILTALEYDYQAKVIHEVDATSEDHLNSLGEGTFDRIIWNFPCVRMPGGADGQNKEMEQNIRLLARFFQFSGSLLKPKTGQIHITHKTKGAFAHWKLEDIAANNGGWHCGQKVVFDRCNYPGYVNKKVLSNKSFPIWDSLTYIFTPPGSQPRPEPCKPEPLESYSPEELENSPLLIPVTSDMLNHIRSMLQPSKNKCVSLHSKNKRMLQPYKKKRRKTR